GALRRQLWPRARLFLAGRCTAVDGGQHRCRAIVGDQSAGLCRFVQAVAHFLLVEATASDDLEEVEGGSIECAVARARLRGGDCLAFAFERRLRPRLGLHRLSERNQPGRRQRGLRGTRLVPPLLPPIALAAPPPASL